MREDKATLGVIVLHGEDAVQTDGCPRTQSGEQALAAGVPEGVAEALGAKLGPDDEEPHEAEFTLVGGDGAAANHSPGDVRGDEGVGVGGPEQPGIMQAGVPTLARSPSDEFVHLGASHVADHQLRGHGAAP